MPGVLARRAQEFEVRDDLREDAFERPRESSAEEGVNDHVVVVTGARDTLPRGDVAALQEGGRGRAVFRACGETGEAARDLEVRARVAFGFVNAAEEDYVHARARYPEDTGESRAVAAVVAAPAEDLRGLSPQVLREARGDLARRGVRG